MSEDVDKESKTEEATPRKIEESMNKGNMPFSREAPIFASLVGVLGITALLARDSGAKLMSSFERLIESSGERALGNETDVINIFVAVLQPAAIALLPVIAILAITGLVASAAQNPVKVVFERIKPEFSRISPGKGWKKLFGAQGFVEFLKACFKFGAIGVIVFMTLRSDKELLVNAMLTDPGALPELLVSLCVRLLAAAVTATVVLMAVDLAWSRLYWRRNLRMTRQELKDEHKQTDGDPYVKARQKAIARGRQKNRMMSAVPRATVVIANPTHFAVALEYSREKGGAPVVLAKGKDLVALRIRRIAEENGVPVIEDKPLARALCNSVEINMMIPPEFYQAVAQIIYFINSRKPQLAAAR